MSGTEPGFSFEPYYESADIRPRDALELQRLVQQYRDAISALVAADTDDGRVEAAGRLLEAQRGLTDLAEEVNDMIYRIPVMVHVAGKPKQEEIDGREVWIQRCSRCGSRLHMWFDGQKYLSVNKRGNLSFPLNDEDIEELDLEFNTWQENFAELMEKADREIPFEEVEWWPEGKRIGRSRSDEGGLSYYDLEDDEDLNNYERMCVSLSDLFTEEGSDG